MLNTFQIGRGRVVIVFVVFDIVALLEVEDMSWI